MGTSASSKPKYGNHREFIVDYINQHKFERIAELGLGTAKLSRRIMEHCPSVKMMWGVDHAVRDDRRELQKKVEWDYHDRYTLWQENTASAAKMMPDNFLDFIFIDAGHTYGAVLLDIKRWTRKLKPTGHLLGHDYHPKFEGVIRAVDECFPRRKILPCYVWSAYDYGSTFSLGSGHTDGTQAVH